MKTHKVIVALVAVVLALITVRPASAAVDKTVAAGWLDKWSVSEPNPEKSKALKIGARALRGEAITNAERALALKELQEFKMTSTVDQEYINLVQTALGGGVTPTSSAPPVSKTVLSTALPITATAEEKMATTILLKSKALAKDFTSHNHALKSATDINALGVATEEGLLVLNGGTTKEDKALIVHILTETAKKAESDFAGMSRLHPDYAECSAVGRGFRITAAAVAGVLTISSSAPGVPVASVPAPASASPAPVAPAPKPVSTGKKLSRPTPPAPAPPASKPTGTGHDGEVAKAPPAPVTK